MSKVHYTYTTKTVIERHRPEVLDVFMDHEQYKEWQGNLDKIELIEGSFNNEGYVAHLYYKSTNDSVMVMEERLIELTLPHKIVLQYQIGPTRNVQTYYFESYGLHTLIHCQTDFYFEQEPPAPQSAFERSTKQSMTLLKEYIEAN
jgi:hypothetical protein